MKTNDDLIKEYFTDDEQKEIHDEIKRSVCECKTNAKKKKIISKIVKLKFEVSEQEKNFIIYARENNINYENLMRG